MLISDRYYNDRIFLQHGTIINTDTAWKISYEMNFTNKKTTLIIYDHNHIMQGLQAMHEKMHHGSVLVELHTGWKMTRSLY